MTCPTRLQPRPLWITPAIVSLLPDPPARGRTVTATLPAGTPASLGCAEEPSLCRRGQCAATLSF